MPYQSHLFIVLSVLGAATQPHTHTQTFWGQNPCAMRPRRVASLRQVGSYPSSLKSCGMTLVYRSPSHLQPTTKFFTSLDPRARQVTGDCICRAHSVFRVPGGHSIHTAHCLM